MDQDVKDILVNPDEAPVDVQKLIGNATAKLKQELEQSRTHYDLLAKRAAERDLEAQRAEADLHGLASYTKRAEHSAISNALAAADAEANTMQADLAVAIETADGKRAADLNRKIAQIEARRNVLVSGKDKIEEEIEQARNAPAPEPKKSAPIPPCAWPYSTPGEAAAIAGGRIPALR